jgi:hypothetical protein
MLSRTGPFPFFKLPKEIRRRIFRLFLGPCFDYKKVYDSSHFHMIVNTYPEDGTDDNSNYDPDLYQGTFERYLMQKRENELYDDPENILVMSSSDYEQKLLRYYEQKAWLEHKAAVHPTRRGQYKLRTIARRGGVKLWQSDDYLYAENIRQASNVSTVFRQELGEAL